MARARSGTSIAASANSIEQQASWLNHVARVSVQDANEIRARLNLIRQAVSMIEAELEGE